MNLTRLAASLGAAAAITLAGVGAGTAFAAPVDPVTPITPVTPVHPVTPLTPVTPSHGSGTHHDSHATPSTPEEGSVLPLVLGGLGIAVVVGGGAYALARGNAADRDRERRVAGPDVRVVPVPPQAYHPRYDAPRYDARR